MMGSPDLVVGGGGGLLADRLLGGAFFIVATAGNVETEGSLAGAGGAFAAGGGAPEVVGEVVWPYPRASIALFFLFFFPPMTL